MAESYDIAVVGAGSLVGETLLEILEARKFPIGRLYLVDIGDKVGDEIAYRGQEEAVQDLESFDFASCALVFFCLDAALAAEYLPSISESGAIVIDDSSAHRLDLDIPLVVPEVNAHVLADYEARRIISNPNSCAIIMALALKAINEAVGLKRVNAVTMQAVSGASRAAVEELAQQAIGLFNNKPLDHEVFPKQIAFNLLPQIGALNAEGISTEEEKIASELKRLLQNDALGVNVTAVRVPVFYGHSIALHVETHRPLDLEKARALFAESPGVVLYEGEGSADYPTPMVEAASNDPVFIGRVRLDPSCDQGLDFWAVADNMRKGGALNMVQIAETLIEKYLG